MKLPNFQNLPTQKLAASFANTSATYKFYWLIALIESVENGNSTIPKRQLFSKMIVNAWYTVNYFKISFGKQDLIQTAAQSILATDKNEILDIAKVRNVPVYYMSKVPFEFKIDRFLVE